MVGVLDIDLDSINELHALFRGLNLLWRELGIRRDERDPSLVGLSGKGVRSDAYAGAELYSPEIRFGYVTADPRPIEIADGHHGRSGSKHLAKVGSFRKHNAINRRCGHGILELRFNVGHLRSRFIDLRTSCRDLLFLAFQ